MFRFQVGLTLILCAVALAFAGWFDGVVFLYGLMGASWI